MAYGWVDAPTGRAAGERAGGGGGRVGVDREAGVGRLPVAGVLDLAAVALRDEPLPATARHLPHNFVVDDASLGG